MDEGCSMNDERVTDLSAIEHFDSCVVQEGSRLPIVDVDIDERRDRCVRTVLTTVLAGLLFCVVIDSLTNQYIHALLVAFINWVKDNPSLGVFAVISVYIVATVLFVPGSILTLGAGYAFGSAFESTARAVAMASTVRSPDTTTQMPGFSNKYLSFARQSLLVPPWEACVPSCWGDTFFVIVSNGWRRGIKCFRRSTGPSKATA